MKDKKPFADYIVTQWLLNPEPIKEFISKQSLPVHVGITGPLKITSLIKFANIVGAKNSINFLKSNATKRIPRTKNLKHYGKKTILPYLGPYLSNGMAVLFHLDRPLTCISRCWARFQMCVRH